MKITIEAFKDKSEPLKILKDNYTIFKIKINKQKTGRMISD